jgi:ribosomal protein L2
MYRIIDFKRDKDGVPAKVASIEYDPNRSSHIALLELCGRRKTVYHFSSGLKVGDQVVSGSGSEIRPGNSFPCGIFLWGRRFTTLSSTRGMEGSSQEEQAPMPS